MERRPTHRNSQDPDDAATDKSSAPAILVVDDDADMRIYVKRCLRKVPCEIGPVFEADNGASALKQIREREITLVISDVVMPVLDGISLTHTLRADESLSHVLILLVTGVMSAHELLELTGSACGVSVLTKPFNADKLGEKVIELLGRSPPGPGKTEV
jgi:two-component system chemotaxis response regulator CheY